ncbi:hypothetical protein MNBD_BACTEROID01-353 [hydrothermal vent metagenome]|uniref:6-bladed beta-propeller n=1 Tax=hydrothermal vent metagenome TaxID=652676 RepID=A0A3B0U7Y2_9ZZZZ
MYKASSYLLFLIVFVIGCSSKSKKSINEKIHSDNRTSTAFIQLPQNGKQQLNASEFADTVIYIPLETLSKSFIRRITQVQLISDRIFLNCFDKLLVYSKNGKFIRQIGKNGKGPGEYLIIFGFEVINDTIFISTTGKRSLLKYSLQGEFLGEQATHSSFAYFTVTPSNSIVEYDRDNETLVFFNRKFEIIDTVVIESAVSNKRGFYSWWDDFDTFFHKSDGKLFFTNYMSDTIWDISSGEKNIGYILNLGDKLLPKKYQVEYFNGDFERFKKMAAPFQKMNLVETPSYLFLFQKGWIENNIHSIYIHDRTKNITRKFETTYIFDDLVGNQNLIPHYSTNNYIIATLNPIKLKEKLKNINNGENVGGNTPSPQWLKQMELVDENDNPILVLMKVRNTN